MINLSEKVILITGGSSGIGAATVQTLAKAEANVVLHYYHKQEAAETIADKIGKDKCYLLQDNFEDINKKVNLDGMNQLSALGR